MDKDKLVLTLNQSIENCGNCLCCMNKEMPDFAFCFDQNKCVNDLNDHCDNWERS